MSFAENLKRIRKEKNLSQEQLAEMIGVSRQAVSKWEQDNGYPETEKLVQIAMCLHVSLDSLFFENEPNSAILNEEIKELKGRQVVFSPDRRIVVQSYDGKTVSSCYKFKVSHFAFSAKGEPKYILLGVDNCSFWGDHDITLGYYAAEEDIQLELNEIYKAIQCGETAYQLKYYVNVKIKMFSIKIVE